MASAALPALTGNHCLNTSGGMVAFLHLLTLLLLSILSVALLGVLTGILAGILTGITGILAGILTGITGILTVALLHAVLATVGALLQHGLANLVLNRVPTAVVAAVAAAVLLLLLLQPGWCRARGVYIPLLLLLLLFNISLNKRIEQ